MASDRGLEHMKVALTITGLVALSTAVGSFTWIPPAANGAREWMNVPMVKALEGQTKIMAGMKYYDLGGIDPENNASVYRFKSRMGGQEVHHIGAFEASDSLYAKIRLPLVERLYRMVKR